ncbi:MAG: lipase family protein [Pseudomonadota bacterium]
MHTVSRHRLIQLTASLVLLASHASAQPNAAPQTAQDAFANLSARAPDAFYAPPLQVPAKPGALLRSEPLKDVTLPAGVRGWRILYTTTIDDKTPATAVATVFASSDPPAGPRPVILWGHATTGLVQTCMPSLFSSPALGIPALDRAVKSGWVVVATDYAFAEKDGPHPYLIGEGEARSGLDAVRAARQISGLTLDARTAVWGHSQGGHAALWTGIIGPRYAPDVPIVGVAAIAPVANLTNLFTTSARLDKRLGPLVALAYSRFYSGIKFDDAVRPEVLQAAREVASLCSFLPPEHPKRIAQLMASFEGRTFSARAALAARLAENNADGPIAAPVLIAQGLTDVIVPPAVTDAHVSERCAANQRLEHWTFAGTDHSNIVRPGGALDEPLIAWTAARFANEPQASGCARKAF